MPSDPTGTNPSGVLVRPAPDFFDDSIAACGWTNTVFTSGDNNWFLLQLFNNAVSGQVLKVYAITSSSDAGGGCYVFGQPGPPSGTMIGVPRSIRLDQGAPYGQLWVNMQTIPIANPNPFTIPPAVPIIGASGFDSATVISTFPLFIIPVGYSLVIANVQGVDNGGGAFWYQVANE